MLIDPAPWHQLLGLGLRLVTSSLSSGRGARHQLAKQVRLSADEAVPVHLDGEPVGSLPISVRPQAGAIRVLFT